MRVQAKGGSCPPVGGLKEKEGEGKGRRLGERSGQNWKVLYAAQGRKARAWSNRGKESVLGGFRAIELKKEEVDRRSARVFGK